MLAFAIGIDLEDAATVTLADGTLDAAILEVTGILDARILLDGHIGEVGEVGE
jgi:VCBS repeat-containing protein